MKRSNTTAGRSIALALVTLLIGGASPLLAWGETAKVSGSKEKTIAQLYAGMTRKVKLNIGTSGARKHIMNTRGMAFGGAAVLVGTGRNERAHVYTATTCGNLVPGSIERIDGKKQAAELGAGVTGFVPNAGRYWTMDEIDIHLGEKVVFQGVGMCWAGDMSADEIKAHMSAPYAIGKILRNTEWLYKAGKPVYLLRDPSGIVWVMQEYTKEIDPTLTIENLDQVGGKLKKLPPGWTFETKVLTKDLSLDTRRTGLWASIVRDELGNTYEAAGFDDLANYVP